MAIRFRIRPDGSGEYLADHVDRLGHRRASRFESRDAAEVFLKKGGFEPQRPVRRTRTRRGRRLDDSNVRVLTGSAISGPSC